MWTAHLECAICLMYLACSYITIWSCLHDYDLLGGILHFLPYHVAIPSQLSLSEQRCHWLDIGFSPGVFVLYVVLLGLASSPSQHSYISGV